MKGIKGFTSILSVIILLTFSALIGGLIFIFNKSDEPNPKLEQSSLNKVLIDEVPNFDNLTINDLPKFYDYRGVFKYKNNFIIVGYSRIVEYDPQKKEVVRQDDGFTLKSIDSAAVIGKYIYVTGDRANQSVQEFPSKRQLWKIDLDTGVLVKEYFPNDPRHFGNLEVTSKDNFLWASSWDGVFKLNTIDDSIKFFDYKEVKVKQPDCLKGIYEEDGKINVLSNCFELGITSYDEKANTWEYRNPVNNEEYTKSFYIKLSDFGIDLPEYLLLSNKIKDKYYIFSNDSISTLINGGFPKFNKKTTINEYFQEASKAFVDTNETYALLVGRPDSGIYGAIPILENSLSAELVDLATGVSTNLIAKHPLAKSQVDNDLEEKISKIPSSTIIETQNGVVLLDSYSEEFLEINYKSKNLIFK